LKEQLAAEIIVRNINIETQKQKQTTIAGLTNAEETNNRTVQELCEKQEQLQTTLYGLTMESKPPTVLYKS
jgi:hypothetical protein